MEVMVGPRLSGPSYVGEQEALRRCPFAEEAAGKGIGFKSSSSESSSSIGAPEDSDEEEGAVVSSKAEGGMASLISLDDALPVKRGLSKQYSGKSKSFANVRSVNSVKEMKKEEKPLNKRRRVLMANKWYMIKKASFYSCQNPNSMPLLADADDLNEDDDDRQPSWSSSSESLKPVAELLLPF